MDYQTIRRVKVTAKLVKKFYKPDLTLMQVQNEIVKKMGFRNWTDFLNTQFSDYYINCLINNLIINLKVDKDSLSKVVEK